MIVLVRQWFGIETISPLSRARRKPSDDRRTKKEGQP
jgi:hypothetical protein